MSADACGVERASKCEHGRHKVGFQGSPVGRLVAALHGDGHVVPAAGVPTGSFSTRETSFLSSFGQAVNRG